MHTAERNSRLLVQGLSNCRLSHGICFDGSYDRTLYASGSSCAGATGTETLFVENLDYELTALDRAWPVGSNHIIPAKLPMRLTNGRCEHVYPNSFLKVSTIMEVIHASG